MQFLIVTGMSGSGKSRTIASLEDLGYYCVDNMPVGLLSTFAEMCMAGAERYQKVALVIDVRAGDDLKSLSKALLNVEKLGMDCSILYLDTETDTLINRYKETRRKHPLMEQGMSIVEAISRERELLSDVRGMADHVVDTTSFSASKLRETIVHLFSSNVKHIFYVNVMSFGFKYGIPTEADLVMDVRFLPNPYYEMSLRQFDGRKPEVRDYVFRDGTADKFMERLTALLDFLIPQYIKEGKAAITIGIGCTGGKHRSVAITEALTDYVAKQGYRASATHRDYKRG